MRLSSLANTHLNEEMYYISILSFLLFEFAVFLKFQTLICIINIFSNFFFVLLNKKIQYIGHQAMEIFLSDSTNLIERIMGVFPHVILRVLKLLNDVYEQQTTDSWSTYPLGIF